jgi:hypothetical protein
VAAQDTQELALSAIDQWAGALEDLVSRIAPRFRRVEVRAPVRRSLVSLLDRLERKNGGQLAEAIGERGVGCEKSVRDGLWEMQ